MQYSLPDIRDEGAYIKSLDSDTIFYARDQIKSHYDAVLKIMDDALANQWESTCSICEVWGYAYKDIPEDWAYIVGQGKTLLCTGCLGRWAERFDTPELSRELELPDYEQVSSVPEDTTHRGQTHIEFV